MAYRPRRGLGATPLANAIFRQEGSTDSSGNWVTSSLGYRNNNPGNLNYAGQPGCHASTTGNGQEAICDTLDQGIAATENQLDLDASRGLTLAQRLQTWATGNQAAYVSNVSSWLGVSPDTPLSDLVGSDSMPTPAAPGSISTDTGAVDASGAPVDDGSGGLSGMAWAGLALAAAAVLSAVEG